jgi:hypothetical protein
MTCIYYFEDTMFLHIRAHTRPYSQRIRTQSRITSLCVHIKNHSDRRVECQSNITENISMDERTLSAMRFFT